VRRRTAYGTSGGRPFPAGHPVHDDGQPRAAGAHSGFIVNWTAVLGARAPAVLDAVQRRGSVSVEDVDARRHRPVAAQGLAFPARAERVEEGGDEEAAVAGEAEVLQVGVERLTGVCRVGVGGQRGPRRRFYHADCIRLTQPHI